MKIEYDINSRGSCKGRSRYIPARYVFAAVSMLGAFLLVVTRSAMPVAITTMVRKNITVTERDNVTGPDTCPSGAVSRNESSVTEVTGEFDWGEMTQNFVMSAAAFGLLATSVIGARIAETWYPKHTYTICSFVSSATFLFVPLLARWNVIALIVFQAIGGLFLGPLSPAGSIMTASWIPPQERQVIGGIILSAAHLGSIASSILTGLIVENMGWQYVFYIFSSLNLAWLVLWIFLIYDSPDNHPNISEEERLYITESTKKDERQAARKLPWKEILLCVPFWAHIIMLIPGNWLSITLSFSLPTYLTNMLHYSTTQAGYFSALPSVFSWLSVVASGILSQWVRRKKYLDHLVTYHIFNGITTLGSAALMLFLTLAHCNDAATISLFCLALVTSSAHIGGSQLNHMDLAINYAGTLSGMSSMVTGLVGILAPLVTGGLTNGKQTLTAWNNVFYMVAAVNIVPFFIYLIFGSVDEQPWNRTNDEENDDTSKNKSSADATDAMQSREHSCQL